MYINPNWRVLTIGDGDLSFSASLLKHHNLRSLTATIFDSHATLISKYGGDEYYQALVNNGCKVQCDFDVTDRVTWGELANDNAQEESTTKKSHENTFDLVIFQFPLLPAFTSKQAHEEHCENFSINTLNRRLLRVYLQHCFRYFLNKNGAQLAYISSKDVKPYRQWNIEQALTMNTSLSYLGKTPFNINDFPGYKIRNVDRDKHVKNTKSFTYVYSQKDNETQALMENPLLADQLISDMLIVNPNSIHNASTEKTNALFTEDNHCGICYTGIFMNEADKKLHFQGSKHVKMQQYQQQWLAYLQSEKPLS